jgi:hypothetical protein
MTTINKGDKEEKCQHERFVALEYLPLPMQRMGTFTSFI